MLKRRRSKKHGFGTLTHALSRAFSLLGLAFKVMVFLAFTINVEKDDRSTIKIMLLIYGATVLIAIVLIFLIATL